MGTSSTLSVELSTLLVFRTLSVLKMTCSRWFGSVNSMVISWQLTPFETFGGSFGWHLFSLEMEIVRPAARANLFITSLGHDYVFVGKRNLTSALVDLLSSVHIRLLNFRFSAFTASISCFTSPNFSCASSALNLLSNSPKDSSFICSSFSDWVESWHFYTGRTY